MATIQELETALVNADKAGDTEAARVLAQELRTANRMRAIGGPTASTGDQYPSQTTGAIEPPPMARMGRGYMDAVDTVRKPFMGPDFQKQVDEDIGRYERGRGSDAGTFDVMRMGGNTAATLPFTGATALAAEAGLGARAAGPIVRSLISGTQGAEQGALTWTPEGQSKAKQAALGFAGGALAPWMSDAVGYVTSKFAQFGKGAAAKLAADPDLIVRELEPVLAKQGVRWGDLTDQVKQGMLSQARKQLSVDGDLSPDMLARKVEMDDLMGSGAGPTRGQVTRDPALWSWERNIQKLQDVGTPLTERYQAQLQRLEALAQEAKRSIGGRAQNAYQAGDSATQAIQQKLADSQRVVGDLYKVWRESGGGGTEVKAQPLADALGKVADEIGTENIPPAVMKRLNDFGLSGGKQTKLLTIDEAEKLRKLIGNNDPGRGPASLASAKLREALDGAVMDTAAPDIPLLQAARSAARERFAGRDSSLATVAASEDAAPDRFFNRYVLNGNVRDLQGLKQSLTTSVMGDKAPAGMDYEPVVMPLYQYRCVECQKDQDAYNTVENRKLGPLCSCGAKTEKVICAPSYVIPDIQPYQVPGSKRVITSRKHHREFLQSKGLIEVGNEGRPPSHD
jgi:hypothetical protein